MMIKILMNLSDPNKIYIALRKYTNDIVI